MAGNKACASPPNGGPNQTECDLMAGEKTRERILETAEELFGHQGFAGTSFRQITSKAEVNLAAIHYHFGSKKGLFEAVLARRIGPLRDERLRRLEALESVAGGRPLALESIIDHPGADLGRRQCRRSGTNQPANAV